MMKKLRVLVVDDSAFMRKLITDIIEGHPRMEVCGVARNGLDAIEKVKSLSPDVMTMDIEMPVMNGLEALQRIMQEMPVPIVILSSTTKEGTENTMLAMQYGAIDFVAKPSGSISLDLHKVKDDIIGKVLSASKVNLAKMTKKERKIVESKPSSLIVQESTTEKAVKSRWSKNSKKLICIGTSTGGPRALQEVLTALPANIEAPIFVVQHMPPGFTQSLANRLDSLCDIRVKEASDGEIVQRGTAYIAPGGYHLKVRKIGASLAVNIDTSPAVNGHRPSVDTMFQSVSELADYDKVAVIMTGMGADGANSLQELKSKGNARVIAESKNSCIVFGMPKAAIATNLVDDVEDLDQIAPAIMKYM